MATPSLTCVSMWTSHLSSNHRVSIPINWKKKTHFFQNWNTNKIDELKLRQFPNKTVTATVMKKKVVTIKTVTATVICNESSETSNCHCNSIIRLSKFLSRNKRWNNYQKNYSLCNRNALKFLNLHSITAIDIVEATASEKREKHKPRESSLKRHILEE